MLRLPRIKIKSLSVRLSLMVVLSMAILLLGSLAVMLHYSRKSIKEEALQKAAQTLEGTVQRIDNLLLSVEQTSGNYYFTLLPHIRSKEMMLTFSRKLVESNPYVDGCAIAFEEGFYKEGECFMAYFHRVPDSDTGNNNVTVSDIQNMKIIQSETFANSPYTEQYWFTQPMLTKKPEWLKTIEDFTDNALITFSLPIQDANSKPVGVLGVDVSLTLLSRIFDEAKPSANSHCILLDSTGSFIVHPNIPYFSRFSSHELSQGFSQHYTEMDSSVSKAVHAMISGETGYRLIRINGGKDDSRFFSHFFSERDDYYIFYRPFKRNAIPGRSLEELKWSAGIIFPEEDIFGDYNNLFYYVLAIIIVGLLLIFLLCRTIIQRQLKPLLMLTESAQRIAKGNFNDPIPDSRQHDEIGRLQDNFQKMQKSLSKHIGELEQLTNTLHDRGEGLRKAYNQAQKADRMKTAFMHNMTNQMTDPADAIDNDVDILCHINEEKRVVSLKLIDNILQNGKTITELLENLINMSDEEIRKEAAND